MGVGLDGDERARSVLARREPLEDLAGYATVVAAACRDIAARFHRGGKLLVFGNSQSSTDAQHLAVEFMHPVVVGKRSLPAISLNGDVATLTGVARDAGFEYVFAHQLRVLAGPDDIAIGLSRDGSCENVREGLRQARLAGMLTLALVGGDGGAIAAESAADHVLVAHSSDARVIKEIHVTIYHILWELVHVFLDRPDLIAVRSVSS